MKISVNYPNEFVCKTKTFLKQQCTCTLSTLHITSLFLMHDILKQHVAVGMILNRIS